MGSAVKRMVGKTVGKRVSGSKPGALRSLAVAAMVGVAAAVLTYRALRSGE